MMRSKRNLIAAQERIAFLEDQLNRRDAIVDKAMALNEDAAAAMRDIKMATWTKLDEPSAIRGTAYAIAVLIEAKIADEEARRPLMDSGNYDAYMGHRGGLRAALEIAQGVSNKARVS